MGLPTTPQEAAPPYEDVFNDHPVNRYAPSGSTSAVRPLNRTTSKPPGVLTFESQYTTIPQTEDPDIELHAEAHGHNHTSSTTTPSSSALQPETLAQTITNFLRPNPEPHTHCEVCDNQVQTEARRRRESEKFCCTMVAATFMTLIVCGTLLGVAVVTMAAKKRRHE
jgi:hypothetical protein